ncbi:MAG: LacI family transcriptional regulator [Verrucomicrobia bacterium]|nr:LacI family transcriptional regulator [Verrucomicrobiota bacterium]
MSPTLVEVSRRAGVSTATVSRVINKSALVTEATRAKVMKAIRELNYHPSRAARMLARQSTETIGVVFPDIQGGFFAEVLHGIDLEVTDTRYHLITAFAHGTQDESSLVEGFLYERSVDGLILMNLALPEEFLKTISTRDMRVVLIDRPAPGFPSVCIDNGTGVVSALAHLTETRGYSRIGFVQGPIGTYDAEERWSACKAFARDKGLILNDSWILNGDFSEGAAFAAIDQLILSGGELPEAFFCLNDHMAFGVMEACRKHGVSIPGDLAVVGFDDGYTARLLRLTTVHVPLHEMGRLAASEAMKGKDEDAAHHVLQTELVIRDSCGSN